MEERMNKKILIFVVTWLLPALAMAASIPLHNTGVNASNVLVAPGAQASFWTLSARPVGAVEAIGSLPFRFNCCYFPDTATAAWVSPQASGSAGVAGIYTYDLVVDLTGLDPASASISGTFGTDNSGSISLNGNAPVATTGSGDFGAPTAFTINSGFVAGLNTIRVQVNNEGDPTAFFVSFTNATANAVAAPIPTASWQGLILLALVLAALGSVLARRAQARR
jgi:hypothetical protein